jgi:cytochrome oxidase assembly protein ShyY1
VPTRPETYRVLVLRTLLQPRYAALSVLMAIVALGCVGAGTWQVARFQHKVHENDALRANAHRPATPVADLLPLVGSGSEPARDDVEFRNVTATGHYDAAAQSLVRSRTVGDSTGYLVLTPFDAGGRVLLVVRGFVPQPDSGGVPTVAAPPTGDVTITARAHRSETRDDAAGRLDRHQVESINAAQQAGRLAAPVYDGYAELVAGEPGTRGLTAMPTPDLSNPAGGALEPQHFAYVIQWYLFAILALAAPLVMARAETRGRQPTEFDEPPAVVQDAAQPSADEVRAAKLADRYGRAR